MTKHLKGGDAEVGGRVDIGSSFQQNPHHLSYKWRVDDMGLELLHQEVFITSRSSALSEIMVLQPDVTLSESIIGQLANLSAAACTAK